MRPSDSSFRRPRGILVAAALAFCLAACASSGDSGGSGLSGLFGGGSGSSSSAPSTPSTAIATTTVAPGQKAVPASTGAPAPAPYDPSLFLNTGYCPPVQIRGGTESLMIYERGHEGDDSYVRFQGSLAKFARECHTNGDTLTIKVGITGRLTAGPKGNAGSFTLPIRVAVVKQLNNKVFFSQVYKAPVSISAPNFSADFSYVVDNVSFQITPDDHDLIIYVGYDEGKPKTPPTPTG